ncbi:hypothetical protein KIL84_005166 [Mauremys mutica]|uniref:Uncharacterized protein n=1 Tax=Mauremys mutica TaxID=74926 RepID=A0A9D4B5V1_9SAUR|nr:hypothetical protein KIL84_005166 [Mauremys mutica]
MTAKEKNRFRQAPKKIKADLRRLCCIINLGSVNRESVCSLTEEELGKCLIFFKKLSNNTTHLLFVIPLCCKFFLAQDGVLNHVSSCFEMEMWDEIFCTGGWSLLRIISIYGNISPYFYSQGRRPYRNREPP